MRKSKAETAKTRERILKAASAQFLSQGITEAGLARLMRAARLTHGGFYPHFASKDQLLSETSSQAVQSLTSGLKFQIVVKAPEQALPPLVGQYGVGLHRGGFYRHFASKDQLVSEACSQAVQSLTSGLKSQIEGKPPDQALPLLVGKYVSRSHRDQPATGCVLAALGSELVRADAKTREAATEGFLGLSRLIAGQLKKVPAKKAEVQSMAIAAAMIGAITLARIVPDSRISNSILVGTREHILKSVRRKR